MDTDPPTSTSRLAENDSAHTSFTLCKIFEAHKQDVKKVVGVSLGSVLSAGRDGSLKLWTERSDTFTETLALAPTNNLAINSAAFYETPNDEWILFAGRKDGSIVVYNSGLQEPIRVLHGHRLNVCALYVDSKNGLLLSGSFDHTALVWSIEEAIKTEHFTPVVLDGHNNSIWAVATVPCEPVMFLTASADKLIRLFDCTANLLTTYKGHTDVVRQIQVLSQKIFISASNDSTIRIWDIDTGACLQTSTSPAGEFIYDICKLRLKNGSMLAISCGERGYVDVWGVSENDRKIELLQTIRTPTHSVWSVTPLRNGDFALGTSSGQVYTFTQNSDRQAPPAIQQAYDEQLSFLISEEIARQDEIEKESMVTIDVETEGGILKLNYVKGNDPTDTAVEFIKTNNLPFSYLDEITRFIIERIPEAKAAQLSKYKRQADQRTSVNGEKFDYSFPVQTDKASPPIVLGYNVGEDPDYVSQTFCEKHNLPIAFFQQLSAMLRQQVPELSGNSNSIPYHDPYSGSNRYIPGGGGGNSQSSKPAQNGHNKGNKKRPCSNLAPLKQFFTFNLEGASNKVLQKLQESNDSQMDVGLKLSQEELSSLNKIMASPKFEAEDLHYTGLLKCLNWSMDIIVPALDVFRTSLLNEKVNHMFLKEKSSLTLQKFIDLLKNGSDPVRILVCRAITNAVVHEWGQSALMLKISPISALLAEQLPVSKPALQLAACSALANIAHVLLLSAEEGEVVTELGPREDVLVAILGSLPKIPSFGDFNPVCLTRLLQCLVTLMWGSADIIRAGKNLDLVPLVNKIKDALHDEDGKILCRDIVEMTFA